ncbi:hypothetical protein AB0D38_47220, partial [Streptomyces sp. NPDC048279]
QAGVATHFGERGRPREAMTVAGTLAPTEPVESLDVVAGTRKKQLGAASVSFFITDFTGDPVGSGPRRRTRRSCGISARPRTP